MRIGFNFTLGETHEMVRRLIDEQHIDYCEFLIDNFLHVPPVDLAKCFDCPVGFHIMLSRFIESDPEFLDDMAKQLRVYINALQLVADASSILAKSTTNRNMIASVRGSSVGKICSVKGCISRTIHPSRTGDAPVFFERVARDTGAGVLFDDLERRLGLPQLRGAARIMGRRNI